MTKYKAATFEEFKRLSKNKGVIAVYYSRQVFEDTVPVQDAKAAQGAPPKAQRVVAGFLSLAAENEARDTIRFIHPLPQYPVDGTEKSYDAVRKKIDEVEDALVQSMSEIGSPSPDFPFMQYVGEIEDDEKPVAMALAQAAQSIDRAGYAISQVAAVINSMNRPQQAARPAPPQAQVIPPRRMPPVPQAAPAQPRRQPPPEPPPEDEPLPEEQAEDQPQEEPAPEPEQAPAPKGRRGLLQRASEFMGV